MNFEVCVFNNLSIRLQTIMVIMADSSTFTSCDMHIFYKVTF